MQKVTERKFPRLLLPLFSALHPSLSLFLSRKYILSLSPSFSLCLSHKYILFFPLYTLFILNKYDSKTHLRAFVIPLLFLSLSLFLSPSLYLNLYFSLFISLLKTFSSLFLPLFLYLFIAPSLSDPHISLLYCILLSVKFPLSSFSPSSNSISFFTYL